jgi:hypothetical protein
VLLRSAHRVRRLACDGLEWKRGYRRGGGIHLRAKLCVCVKNRLCA